MAEQRQLSRGDAETDGHFIGAHETAILAHDADVVAQSHHEARAKGMTIDGADRGNRQGDEAAHEGHELSAEGIRVPAFRMRRGVLAPLKIQPIGEELFVGRARHECGGSSGRLHFVECLVDVTYKGGVPAVLARIHGEGKNVILAGERNHGGRPPSKD